MFEDLRCVKILVRRKVLLRKQWEPGAKETSQMNKKITNLQAELQTAKQDCWTPVGF